MEYAVFNLDSDSCHDAMLCEDVTAGIFTERAKGLWQSSLVQGLRKRRDGGADGGAIRRRVDRVDRVAFVFAFLPNSRLVFLVNLLPSFRTRPVPASPI